MPGDSGGPVVTTLVCYQHFAHEAAGASGARHSPRPLFSRATISCTTRAHCAARSRRCVCRHCEERQRRPVRRSSKSEGGSNPFFVCGSMECFASLVMTKETHSRPSCPINRQIFTALGREILNNPNRPMQAVLKLGIEGPFPERSGARARNCPGRTALIRPKSRCVLGLAGS